MKTYSNYTSIGSYPTEGECYCIECANKFANDEDEDQDMTEDDRIFSRPDDSGISQAINWETQDLYCSSMHGCGESIEAAYQD